MTTSPQAQTQTVELTVREAHQIMSGLYERERAIRRKRSWRPSEKAVALASNRKLHDKIKDLFPGVI